MATVQLYPETSKLERDGKAFEVPEFTPPYRARLHPLAEEACKHANAWLLDHSVHTMFTPEKFVKLSDCAMLAAFVYPDASAKKLDFASSIMMLTWAMDDSMDDCQISEIDDNWKKSISFVLDVHLMMRSSFPDSNLLSQQLMQFLEKLPSNSSTVLHNFLEEKECMLQVTSSTVQLSPVAFAYHDYWKEVTSLSQRQSSLRVAYYFQEYLLSSLVEMHNKKANIIPSIEEYVTLRRQSGAVLFFLVLNEIIEGVTLVEEIWHTPEMRRLLNAANDFVILHNDIWSYKKDCLVHGDVQNMVFLVSFYSQCSVEEGSLIVTNMLYEKCQEVELAAKELLEITEPKHRHVVNLYIRGCRDFISGTNEFHKKSIRYK